MRKFINGYYSTSRGSVIFVRRNCLFLKTKCNFIRNLRGILATSIVRDETNTVIALTGSTICTILAIPFIVLYNTSCSSITTRSTSFPNLFQQNLNPAMTFMYYQTDSTIRNGWIHSLWEKESWNFTFVVCVVWIVYNDTSHWMMMDGWNFFL